MKTSTILLTLILFNMSAIVSEPIYEFTQNINTGLLIALEVVLLILFLLNNTLKQLGKTFESDMNISLTDKDVNFYKDENSYYYK